MDKPITVAIVGAAAIVAAALIAAFAADLSALLHPSDNRVIWVIGSVQLPASNSGFTNKWVGGQAKVRYTDTAAGQWKTDSLISCISEGDPGTKRNNCSNNSIVHLSPGTHIYNYLVGLQGDASPWWKDRTKVVIMVCAMPPSRLPCFASPPDMRFQTDDPPCGFHTVRLVGFWKYWVHELTQMFA